MINAVLLAASLGFLYYMNLAGVAGNLSVPVYETLHTIAEWLWVAFAVRLVVKF